MKKLAIIGSGPAGITAAISASRFAGEDVEIHIFEQKPELCKTILATGNGRCNFSNVVIDVDQYHNADFVREFNSHKQAGESVCEILTSLGLEITTNDAGLMFPASMKASSVRDVLLNALASEVIVHTDSKVVVSDDYDATILAAGHFGQFDFEKKLCPIVTAEDVSVADNVRSKVRLSLIRDRNIIFEEAGEVQFRKYGISGIVTFNASRYVQKGDVIHLDFTEPCLIEGSTKEHFQKRLIHGCHECYFQGFLHDDLAKLIESRIKNEDDFEEVWQQISAFELTVDELYEDEKISQVSRGGISVTDIDPKSLQVKNSKVYACGEVIDVDGPCGGYNLTWAFESGWRAGKCVAMSLRS